MASLIRPLPDSEILVGSVEVDPVTKDCIGSTKESIHLHEDSISSTKESTLLCEDSISSKKMCIPEREDYIGHRKICIPERKDCIGHKKMCIPERKDCIGSKKVCVHVSEDCIGNKKCRLKKVKKLKQDGFEQGGVLERVAHTSLVLVGSYEGIGVFILVGRFPLGH